MNKSKILIAAGGTGGHLFPAQGLAQQLINHPDRHIFLFVAGGLSTNRYFDSARFPYKEISTAPLISRNPFKLLKGMFKTIGGIKQSVKIIKDFKPDVVVGFGSFYTVPILLAARMCKIPIVLHEANSVPGKANQWLAPLADAVGIHFPSTAAFFKQPTFEVGLPLREGYKLGICKTEGYRYFNLDEELTTVLIFGGSQGAKAINELVKKVIQKDLKKPFQVIHLTGDDSSAQEMFEVYAKNGIRAAVKKFEKEMHHAWAIADCFISRSGASTIAEAMEFEVPGILIPYPYATDQHQERNAEFFVDVVGGGAKCLEEHLTADELSFQLKALLNEQEREKKKQAINKYKNRPSIDLCTLVLQSAERKKEKNESKTFSFYWNRRNWNEWACTPTFRKKNGCFRKRSCLQLCDGRTYQRRRKNLPWTR